MIGQQPMARRAGSTWTTSRKHSECKSPTDFETRVNEIYEGDGLIFIRASQDGEKLVLEGWEDLNGNNAIDDGQDDKLFSIVKKTTSTTCGVITPMVIYNSHFGAVTSYSPI